MYVLVWSFTYKYCTFQELEITCNAEKKACEELAAQLEHRKAITAKKVKDEEERKLKEQQRQREEERRLQQQKLKKQREDEEKRKREEAEREKWKELRLLQEKQDKEKLEQQKKEEDAKKLLEIRQRMQNETDRRKQRDQAKWDELRKLQEQSVTALPEPLQPALLSSTVSPITNESTTLASLPPKKKPAPAKPQPYKKRPPAITVTTQSPSPTTSSWEADFKGITMVTSTQVATITTASNYANFNMATATMATSPTITKPKAKDMIEDLSTVSLDERCFSSALDDVLTQSTHVSASAELV